MFPLEVREIAHTKRLIDTPSTNKLNREDGLLGFLPIFYTSKFNVFHDLAHVSHVSINSVALSLVTSLGTIISSVRKTCYTKHTSLPNNGSFKHIPHT